MKILVVDDHPLILEAMRHVLPHLRGDLEILTAGDAESALEVARQNPQLEMVLLDLRLPGSRGFYCLATLRDLLPSARVVVVSALDRRELVLGAIDHGAFGFIPKTYSPEAIAEALTVVLSGRVYLPRDALSQAADQYEDSAYFAPAWEDFNLTQREIEVAELLLRGMQNKAIADKLNMAPTTARVHVSSVLQKLGVRNRTEAVCLLAYRGSTLSREFSRIPPPNNRAPVPRHINCDRLPRAFR
jgi:DNA-binding NarL/FixJ family response regulator